MSDLQARIAAELHTAMDAYKARAECDRLICAAAALRGDLILKGPSLDGARRVELMAHEIKKQSGGAA